jgi:hypothetical protein
MMIVNEAKCGDWIRQVLMMMMLLLSHHDQQQQTTSTQAPGRHYIKLLKFQFW